ncbi:hypothetical protein VOLCADRAFT_86496 [Volvox carteri f. nagariensis]|uniref:Nucleoporin Nup88 n=1 Tax=Volvox carteri f. nagariensis TaxID=3068 RepID=D8TGV5_VOLCA|nr:uncharacterized protein VOLCADRAFT_86496 [Volvox carteri f. nagariensis]EFJ52965.1 hypothetical protein VOLCADRAFT_86496 [Volvox carteri f. nagariensis]|eukprot:XP_002945970.1 hypothetical protein VOLCADRAFT_86496 [Volvox carteri f. nagariensis]
MSRDLEQVVDLRDVTALDADAAGNIYTLQRQEDGQVGIVVLDGRHEVLEAQQRQGSLQAPARITSPAATNFVRTHPAIDFDVRGLQVAPSGRYLLLHGTSYQDASVVVMAVVDLHGGQPAPSNPHARSGHAVRVKSCRLLHVDPVLFGSRPGLVLYQASWHPHSEEHLVLLTSDNRLRLYRVTHSLAVAEQTLHAVLASGPTPQRYGLGSTAASPALPLSASGESPASTDIVAFGFGPAVGWGLFSYLLLAADGLVYSLGPVAPFGMRCASVLLERLGQEETAAVEWLEAVFGPEAVQNTSSKNRWQVLPHVVEGVSPAVVGPLNASTRHELPRMARAVSLAVSHMLTAGAAGASAPSSVGTAVVGSAEGQLLAYAVVGPWAPAWCESAPQYMSVTGTASAAPSAVRYKCTLNVTSRGDGAGTGTAAAVTTPGMVLLDVVDLGPVQPHRVAGKGDGAAAPGDVEDEEEEDADDDEYSVSASAVAAARRAMSIHIQAGVTGSAAVVAGPGATATVWVCQRLAGCWRVTLPWSGMLAQWLADAAGAPPSRGGDALPAELPAPVVTCVYDATAASQVSATPAARSTAAGSMAVVGSSLLLNPLLGGGLLVLTAEGVLNYFQPAGAASLLIEQQQHLAAAASPHDVQQQQQVAMTTSTPLPRTAGASPEQRKAQVEAHIKSVYGNLIVPPPDRKLPGPPSGAPKPLTVASTEGLRHLTDCIAALRGKHMAFLHGAAVDLQSRADALRVEAGKHAAAVVELAEMAAGLEGRQESLEARLSRVKLLHDNLVERAGMLASLHWSLPRALSHAEIAASEEMRGAEERVGSLRAQWDAISARARRLCEQRRSSGAAVAGVRMASIPESQLNKVQDTVMAQYSGLAAARAALTTLERLAGAAAMDRTAEQLDKGLGRMGLADWSLAPAV